MIKNFLQSIVATAIAMVTTPYIVTGFKVDNTVETILIASVVLVLVNFFVKPIVSLISFPINAVTMGFFGLIVGALMLFITSYLVGGILIEPGKLTINYFGLNFPVIELSSWYLTLLAASIVISTVNWILRKILL
jgi:putative membrane protein